ncbi:MAG: endonuclease/exonuclease/phosphatase family protein [Flavobacteriales bacterium]|nr:endonuclease/exonuclease/phosphatase family protein [Flavobacteriales bacterium]
MKIPNWLQYSIGLLLLLLSLSHWFPLGIWTLELLSAFAHFSLVLSILIAVISGIFRLWILTTLSIVAVGLCASLVLPQFSDLDGSDRSDLIIAHFNVLHSNPSQESAIAEIAACNADIFTIQELNATWMPLLDSIFAESHPYTIAAPWDTCCYGIGIFSKFPITSYEVLDIENTPVIVAHLLVNELDITAISIHTLPPVFPNETEERNKQLKIVAEIAQSFIQPVIVLGDFNVVPWDASFKSFLENGRLSTVRDGFQATFPMDFGFPLIPIDYITHSEGLIPTSCESVSIPGSDHLGLVAGFAFKDQ